VDRRLVATVLLAAKNLWLIGKLTLQKMTVVETGFWLVFYLYLILGQHNNQCCVSNFCQNAQGARLSRVMFAIIGMFARLQSLKLCQSPKAFR
jgi:hypothetical protein